MPEVCISKEQARSYLVHYQGLDNSGVFDGENVEKGILEYIKRVGCIQFDPLNVVGQNPDLVLRSRIRGYTHTVLEAIP